MITTMPNSFHLPFLIGLLSAISFAAGTTLTYTVAEEANPQELGSVILDADIASRYGGNIPSILSFSLLNPSPYIGIDSKLSSLRTTQRIDRESMCMDKPNEQCIIEIDIIVGPNIPLYFQMIKAQVIIRDINDNSPIFPHPVMDLMVPENAPINSTVFLPMAADRDSDEFGVADYELVSHTEAFRITSLPTQFGGSELLLILAKKLDRETQVFYNLKLVARDYGNPSRTGLMLLNVTVGDDNDNTPQFQQPMYSVRVPESAEPQIMLTRVLANDRDSGENGAIKYTLGSTNNAKIRRLFHLDETTGELFLRQKLDYESDRSFLIPITASDSAPLPKHGQSFVNISIVDENDNAPQITVTTVGSKRAQVIEHSSNGTFVAHVRVRDEDSGSNGVVNCLIISPYFLLRQFYENEYNLVVNSVLDREINSELNVTIFCSDGGTPQKVGREYLTINIVDVNDQKPMFEKLVYYPVPILENNYVGMNIIQVKARDRDIDTNAEVQYELGDEFHASYFSVDRMSGVVTAKTRLDREEHKDYTFSVLAIDRGQPPLTATAAVYIRLADVNDNAPQFNVTHYQMAVVENRPKYSFVGKVSAVDLDEGTNSEIWYRMVNASTGPFIIAHDTGIISTRTQLDREKVGGSLYQITVIASDYGTPSLSSEVKVNIAIIDENDNKPLITSPDNMTLTCSYQTPVNETIGKVKAYDADSGDNGKLGFFIQSGNKYNMFGIDKSTGEVKLRISINSQMVGYYRLIIGVHDNGQPPYTVLFTIGIQITKEAYVPYNLRVGEQPVESKEPKTRNVNLIVVVVLSSTSGVLSIILIIAIIRIKRQTKENHSYNCRTEAQKLFNYSGRSSHQQSCGSSWAGLSTTDQSSVFSRGSACSENDGDEPDVTQTFLTTFATNQSVVKALQTYNRSHLEKQSDETAKPASSTTAKLKGNLNETKEPDGDSGNCDDICSVHNSTPVLAGGLHSNPAGTAQGVPSAHQSFQYKFLSTTGVGGGTEAKVPSSISSGNNSINTNSSQNESPATKNSYPNQKHEDGTIVSGHNKSRQASGQVPLSHRPPHPQESSSDNYPAQNTSDMSDQTINGDRLCAHIDDLFFSEIV